MTLVPGDVLWSRRLVQYILACYEKKLKRTSDTLADRATLMNAIYVNVVLLKLGTFRFDIRLYMTIGLTSDYT